MCFSVHYYEPAPGLIVALMEGVGKVVVVVVSLSLSLPLLFLLSPVRPISTSGLHQENGS